jgi:alanine-glyoxylate transaminase/serine-glyoxylate transaminase/serine-pyruvate transaminase
VAPPDDPRWHDFFRVGHMGHLSAHSLMGTLGCIGAGLAAVGVPHGESGLEAAARVIAGSR